LENIFDSLVEKPLEFGEETLAKYKFAVFSNICGYLDLIQNKIE